jgi:hypothetical protein
MTEERRKIEDLLSTKKLVLQSKDRKKNDNVSTTKKTEHWPQ